MRVRVAADIEAERILKDLLVAVGPTGTGGIS